MKMKLWSHHQILQFLLALFHSLERNTTHMISKAYTCNATSLLLYTPHLLFKRLNCFSWFNVMDVYHITGAWWLPVRQEVTSQGHCFSFFYRLHEKHPFSPAEPHYAVCDPHKTEGTARAYVLTVCTHIICHTALSVIIAWWGHQPLWEQLCWIMCGMRHSSAAAPTSSHHNLSVWRSDLSCWQGGTLSPTKTCAVNCFFMWLAPRRTVCSEYIYHVSAHVIAPHLLSKIHLSGTKISLDVTWMKMHFWHC